MTLLEQIRAHLGQMAPHQRERKAGQLLEQAKQNLEEIEKENTFLRALAAKIMPCHYCGVDDIGKCPSGFPGCAMWDDLCAFEPEMLKEQAKTIRELQEQIKLNQEPK